MKVNLNRRRFLQFAGASATAAAASGITAGRAEGPRDQELNILCGPGYDSNKVLDPFRVKNGAKVTAECGTSDPELIERLRSDYTRVWDLINVNQPWARQRLFPEGLIRPLPAGTFLPYFENMLEPFKAPYRWSLSDGGQHLIGMVQRFGPLSFVVDTEKISRGMAEDQGFDLFNDKANAGKYGILAYEDWNILHMCIGAGINPFTPHTEEHFAAFETVAHTWFKGARMVTEDMSQINLALVMGEIDFYVSGGTYTASSVRLQGAGKVRGITPRRGPINGKGGILWVEVTSVTSNPQTSPLAERFLRYVQQPGVCHSVAMAENTHNPVAQMGSQSVLDQFTKGELDAIQWDSLGDEMANCVGYQINPDYERMLKIYRAARHKA